MSPNAKALSMAALALLAGCTHGTKPATPAGAHVIPLAPYVAKLRKVEVTVDGEPRDFLFDTGGGYTFVSPEVKDVVGCEPSGKLTGFRMSGERVDFAKCGVVEIWLGGAVLDVEAGLFDINSLLPDTLPALHGVLSMHTFADEILTLDLARNLLIVETPESLRERVRSMQPLHASFYNELEGRGMDVYLKVDAGDKQVHMLLDSGNLAGNILAPAAWREVSSEDAPDEGRRAPVTLRFGDAGMKTLPVAVKPIVREGALDVDFVESGIFTFDFPNRRAWVRWNEGAAQKREESKR